MFSLKNSLEEAGYNVETLTMGLADTFRRAIAGVARAAQAEWIRLAQARLITSRADYIAGLRRAESFLVTKIDGEPTYTIQLVGRMPNNFEFGMPAFDMKTMRPGWLGGGKAKTAADGHRYVVIPFRHSTDSRTNLGYSGKAAMMGLQTQLRVAVREYDMKSMVRDRMGAPVPGAVARIPADPDVHSYLRGLTRIQDVRTSGGRTSVSAQLLTWRIMSENSHPSSWQHPGLEAANLLPEVERWVESQLRDIVTTVMKAG